LYTKIIRITLIFFVFIIIAKELKALDDKDHAGVPLIIAVDCKALSLINYGSYNFKAGTMVSSVSELKLTTAGCLGT
jgi:hypothetical protein